MVSQSQRDTTGDRSALGISCRCARAIAGNNNALAIHISNSLWTRVLNESIKSCNLLSLRGLQRKSGELFQLLNKQETENDLSEVTSSDRPENKTSSCTPLSQALASHLCVHMEVQTDARELCRRAAGWHATFEVLRRKMSGPTNCPAHFSTANETFFGAVLCTSYFLCSCFRMHWMGKVSSCGTNVIQRWILISDHISTSLKMWINGYLPKFLWPFHSSPQKIR